MIRSQLASIVDSSDDAIIGKSLEGFVTSWNPGAEKIFGYSAAEVVGLPMLMLIPRDRLDEEAKMLDSIRRGEHVLHFETVRVRKDGAKIDVSVTISPMKDGDGRIIGTSKIARDITLHKQAEKALQASEERFRSLLSALTQVVWTADADGLVVHPLPTWQDFTGQTNKEIMGAGGWEAVHMDDREQAAQVWKTAMEEKSHFVAEYRLRRHDGMYRTVAAHGVPVFNEDGSIREWVGSCTDITEGRQMQAAQQQKMGDLTQSNAEWEQFGYVASHDLQEPLRSVANCVQLLKKRYGGKLDERADEFITHAVDGVRRMKALIDDLMLYSQIGTASKSPERTDCSAVMRDVLNSLEMSIKESGARVTFDPLPVMTTVRGQMAQLFQNLIANAIKFHSERPPEVQVSAVPDHDGWLFSVTDNGIGIDPSYGERIFRVFQRLHTRTHYQGTGIGLAICKKIVALHGGKIWTLPNPQGGSIFCFTLPTETCPPTP